MNTFLNIAILLSFFAFQCLSGEEAPEDSSNKLVLVKVASLNTIDANKEFQKNVQLVQQQRALAAQILSKIETTADDKQKTELQAQFDSLQKKLNDNNQQMFKTYGFSLNRNYVLTVEKAHIHMWVTEEEAKAITDKTEAGDKKTESKKTGFRSLFNKKK